MSAVKHIINATDADYIAVAATVTGASGKQGLPFCGWGPPGSGKSSLVKATLQAVGYKVIALDLGVYEPSDMVGIPRVSDAPQTEFKMHPLLWEAYNNGESGYALLLDDATHAPPALQTAAMRLVLERSVGGHDLSHVPVFLTANPPDLGGIYELNPAFANRMVHFIMDSSNATRYEQGESLLPKVDVDQIKDRFEACLSVAKATTNEFKRKVGREEYTESAPPERFDGPEDYAYATGRSWSYATRLIAGCDAAGVSGQRMVKASVGAGASSAYAEFVTNLDLPAPEEVLAHDSRVNWKMLTSQRPDAAAMAMEAAAWAVRDATQLRGLLRAAMAIRKAGASDLPAHSLRLVRGRTQKVDDCLHGQLTDEVTEELIETMTGLGLKV
jgi:hypothetical protein